jgi:hypothetical protein
MLRDRIEEAVYKRSVDYQWASRFERSEYILEDRIGASTGLTTVVVCAAIEDSPGPCGRNNPKADLRA